MVRLIMGGKGEGKTKTLIEMLNNAAKDEPGSVVCIEAVRNMTFNIHYQIRLIDAQEYDLRNYDIFRGFITGLYAGNYDISHIFIDDLRKIVGKDVDHDTEAFLDWLDLFGERNGIKFTVTISADRDRRNAPLSVSASVRTAPQSFADGPAFTRRVPLRKPSRRACATFDSLADRFAIIGRGISLSQSAKPGYFSGFCAFPVFSDASRRRNASRRYSYIFNKLFI